MDNFFSENDSAENTIFEEVIIKEELPSYHHFEKCEEVEPCGSPIFAPAETDPLSLDNENFEAEETQSLSSKIKQELLQDGDNDNMNDNSSAPLFICGLCGESFVEESELISHLSINHSEKRVKYSKKLYPFTCNAANCLEKFSTPARLLKHFEQSHKPEQFPKMYMCKTCKARFSTASLLAKHLVTHTGIFKSIRCTYCNQVFWKTTDLIKHMSIHASHFTCETCKTNFVTAEELTKHSLTHTTQETFPTCEYCGKQFVRMEDLIDHLTIHPIPTCAYCRQTFEFESILNIHLLAHKEQIQDSTFMCEHCKKQFLRMEDLTQHLLTHPKNNFPTCTHCKKQFVRVEDLTDHLTTHTFHI